MGDQPQIDQLLPVPDKGALIHGQAPAQGLIGIKAQAAGIGDRDQKQIQRGRAVGAPVDVVLADQPLVEPAELSGDFTDTLGANGTFDRHGNLLGLGDEEYRRQIVAYGVRP